MPNPSIPAKSEVCTSDCRNGQIWNPGSGPYPCPLCRPAAAVKRGRPMNREQWPAGANTQPTKPIYTCAGCGAQSSSPIHHTHRTGR